MLGYMKEGLADIYSIREGSCDGHRSKGGNDQKKGGEGPRESAIERRATPVLGGERERATWGSKMVE